MDPLLIVLIIVAALAMSGWGYGYYARPVAPAGGMVAAPAYGTPLGVIGALAVVALLVVLLTGWRPFLAP